MLASLKTGATFALALLMATFTATTVAAAEYKIGFVDGQRVVNESPQALEAKKRIEKEFEPRDRELQEMARRLKAMQEDLDKNSLTMSDSQRRDKERELGELNRDFQRRQREFREDLNVRQNDEIAIIFDHVNAVIKKIAEEEKYDLIVQEAVYFSPRIDMTEKVLKSLGNGPAGK